MDKDMLALCAMLAIFITFPVAVALITTGSIAYSRTKKWDRERTLQAANVETSRLVDAAADDESDFFDTDDEAEHHARKAEEEADSYLTFGQKLRKEFRKVWSGKGAKDMMREKEREERRKLAKAVAKELDRRERRRARKAERPFTPEEELPAYRKE